MKKIIIIIANLIIIALVIFGIFNVWTCDTNTNNVERIFTTISLILVNGLWIWYSIRVYKGWN